MDQVYTNEKEMMNIIMRRNEDLLVEEAVKILKSNSTPTIAVPPTLPKAGEVYVFKADKGASSEDWRCDQYRWYQNGSKKLPSSKPVVLKTYFVAMTPQGKNLGFKRHMYRLLDCEEDLVLLHYIGDHNIGSQHPHGNSKGNNPRPYIRTCPSVLRSISEIKDSPSNIYKQMVQVPTSSPNHQPVLMPRNPKQIKNVQANQRQLVRLTHDALYNLHELAYDLDGFVYKITTFTDLVVICGLKAILLEVDRIIKVKSQHPILLSYDTTFKLGDFYVSILLFKHALFVEAPAIPAAFLIHERKFQASHEEFIKFISASIPSLAKLKEPVPIVTDDEAGICNAIDQCLPGVYRLQCWNHLINSVKAWLRSHGAISTEIPVYISHLRQLFHQETESMYLQKLEELHTEWSEAFVDYYMEKIHQQVTKTIGRCVLEKLNVYNELSGITTNQSEGYNTLLKHYGHWKEAPLDTLILGLYQLQVFYHKDAPNT